MGLSNLLCAGAIALFVFSFLQVTHVGGTQSNPATTTDAPDSSTHQFHEVGKRSVSILARNGELPYYRKEWNKKLHPGFRGMNLENTDETSIVNQRNVGALARGGGLPMGMGKRDSDQLNSLGGTWPEEAILEAYLAEELRKRLLRRELAAEGRNMDMGAEDGIEDVEGSEEFNEKRGGVGSLARAGYMPSGGRYWAGKRSLAALARSGEILSIGRGSNQDREGGNGGTKRGIGSIIRNGGISNLGRMPVYNVGKRGIESLARNYALPSMLSDDYSRKYDLMDKDEEEMGSRSMEEPYGDEFSGEVPDAPGLIFQDDMIKRHLGSFARNYGLRLGNKRNIGSFMRNGGSLHYAGKRSDEEVSDYDEDYSTADKRHISSLLKSQGKRDGEDEFASNEEKRHLGSILNDHNAFIKGKRYLGSIARQGLLGGRQERRDGGEEAYDNGQYIRGDYAVDKRSVSDDRSGSIKSGDPSESQGRGSKNGTANEELKENNSGRSFQRMSAKQQADVSEEMRKDNANKGRFSLRQRRSLTVPYSNNDEYPMPVLQNTDFYDWEAADDDDITEGPDKRFMGSLPRWSPRQFGRGAAEDDAAAAKSWPIAATYQLQKRHIGALARLGWLPAIRSQRRYSRGLGKRKAEEGFGGRENTSHRTKSTTDWKPTSFFTPKTPISLIGIAKEGWPRREVLALEDGATSGIEDWTVEDGGKRERDVSAEKRYLLLPAIDHLLLRKLYPRQMLPLIV